MSKFISFLISQLPDWKSSFKLIPQKVPSFRVNTKQLLVSFHLELKYILFFLTVQRLFNGTTGERSKTRLLVASPVRWLLPLAPLLLQPAGFSSCAWQPERGQSGPDLVGRLL